MKSGGIISAAPIAKNAICIVMTIMSALLFIFFAHSSAISSCSFSALSPRDAATAAFNVMIAVVAAIYIEDAVRIALLRFLYDSLYSMADLLAKSVYSATNFFLFTMQL